MVERLTTLILFSYESGFQVCCGLENQACLDRSCPLPMNISGDHTCGATPVPIPNTAVKPIGPMVVHTSARVGYCRNFIRKPSCWAAFFVEFHSSETKSTLLSSTRFTYTAGNEGNLLVQWPGGAVWTFRLSL